MAIQYRYTVSVWWVDGDGKRLVSKVIDASSPEKAARVAFDTLFPKHDRVWVYSWLASENQLSEFVRGERGKVAVAGK